jgi:hypothetical protein
MARAALIGWPRGTFLRQLHFYSAIGMEVVGPSDQFASSYLTSSHSPIPLVFVEAVRQDQKSHFHG